MRRFFASCGAGLLLLLIGCTASAPPSKVSSPAAPPTDASHVVAGVIKAMETHGVHRHLGNGLNYSGYGQSLFTVEMYFDDIALFHAGDVTLGKTALRIYLALEKENGFIQRHWDGSPTTAAVNPYALYEGEEHAQPFLFQIALFLSRASGGEVSWLTDEMYGKLKGYLKHWATHWDRDSNGLSEWASAPHAIADTQFDRAGVWRSFYCEGADLNSFIYLEYLAAEKIALAKGLRQDASDFARQAQRKKELIERLLWKEQDGFYYDRDIRTGKPITVKSVNGFYPLWADIPDARQAKRLVNEHLMNPKEFWSAHPLPSYALNERNYTQHHVPPPSIDIYYALGEGHCNWRGGLWAHSNYMLAHALERYGFRREARLLADKTYEVAAADPDIYEWYDAVTGAPKGAHPLCAGAQVLMRFLPTELETGFDPVPIEDATRRLDNSKLRKALSLNGKLRLPAL